MQRIHAANSDFKSGDILQKGPTTFMVKSKRAGEITDDSKKWYNVQLGSDSVFPSCECVDFERHYLPCKHFFAIFHQTPGYSWECLPEYFRNNIFITIDNSFTLHCTNCEKRDSDISYHDITEDVCDVFPDNDPPNTETTKAPVDGENMTSDFNAPCCTTNSADIYNSDASIDLSPSSQNDNKMRPSKSIKVVSEKLRSNL